MDEPLIELRLPRWLVVATAIVAALVGLYFLGDAATPRGADGRPVLLSPSVRAAEHYRRQAREWTARAGEIEGRLAALLGDAGDVADPVQLYALADQAQRAGRLAEQLAADATFTPAPLALGGLQGQIQAMTTAYLEAARAAGAWVSAPTQELRQAAVEALAAARVQRQAVEEGPWMR